MSRVDLPDGEPAFGPWRPASPADVLDALGRPRVLAVDGRSGAGKTTFVSRLVTAAPGAAVVHTDDVAWYQDFFEWADLLVEGVVMPWRAGRDVAYRPPAWDERARSGAITAAAAAPLLVVEGVGVGRRALSGLFDALVWVQTERGLATERGIARDGDSAFWTEWEARERPFLAVERPWERARLVASGTSAEVLLVAEP